MAGAIDTVMRRYIHGYIAGRCDWCGKPLDPRGRGYVVVHCTHYVRYACIHHTVQTTCILGIW